MANAFAALAADDLDDKTPQETLFDNPSPPKKRMKLQDETSSSISPQGRPLSRREAKRHRKRKRKEKGEITKQEVDSSAASKSSDENISDKDLDVCIQVLREIGKDLSLLDEKKFKRLRVALHPIIDDRLSQYQTQGPQVNRMTKKMLSKLDTKYREKTALRAKRKEMLDKMCDKQSDGTDRIMLTWEESSNSSEGSQEKVFGVLDGVAEIEDLDESDEEVDRSKKEELRSQKFVGETTIPSSCYICKRPYTRLHFFYDQLCPSCAQLNYRKRNEVANLEGRIAIVTGGRVKIGFRCCLKLLRSGAEVICTTRFPSDAASRFAKEKDFDEWKHRLHVYGIDFRHISGVESFCAHISSSFSHVDIIINNACQTIRRPPTYYNHLMESETLSNRSVEWAEVLTKFDSFAEASNIQSLSVDPSEEIGGESETPKEELNHEVNSSQVKIEEIEGTSDFSSPSETHLIEEVDEENSQENSESGKEDNGKQEVNHSDEKKEEKESKLFVQKGGEQRKMNTALSAHMSQVVLMKEDTQYKELFPVGKLDVNQQQLDLRKQNSWTMKLADVSTPELAEVMAINTIAPTIINARLRSAMERSPYQIRFIVNVSAMEGKFYRFKSSNHPHTNMAKAALNMMTRTSAQDYRESSIYMTSVDTGWINDENPLHKAVNHMKKHNFQTPLDEIDAAARVLDPVVGFLVSQEKEKDLKPLYGVFLKDFEKCEW